MMKACLACKKIILNASKQWVNQIYCSTKCRKSDHRKRGASKARVAQRRANLTQNDEILCLVRNCRSAKTVQILHGHDLNSFIETMKLVRERPAGDVHLCHIYPVKGGGATGLFNYMNLFYGGAYQNRKFQNGYISGGLFIHNDELIEKWVVRSDMSNNEVLLKIEEFLGGIIPDYLRLCPVRKSKRANLAYNISGLDKSQSFEDLMKLGYKELEVRWGR